jgi:hypothetical protein
VHQVISTLVHQAGDVRTWARIGSRDSTLERESDHLVPLRRLVPVASDSQVRSLYTSPLEERQRIFRDHAWAYFLWGRLCQDRRRVPPLGVTYARGGSA